MRISDWSSDVCSSDLAGLLTEWYCPAAGLEVDCDSYRAAWDEVLPLAEEDDAPKVTVLRDYHAENIMLIPDHASSHGLGLLDFQDALVGHPAYDLVSLLQDARRDVPPDIEAEMIAHYKARSEEHTSELQSLMRTSY